MPCAFLGKHASEKDKNGVKVGEWAEPTAPGSGVFSFYTFFIRTSKIQLSLNYLTFKPQIMNNTSILKKCY